MLDVNQVRFGGTTFQEERDGARLRGQLLRVFAVMCDGQWRTIERIAQRVSGSEAGISARLRDLRKKRYGGHTVERKYVGNGVWMYRVLVGEWWLK